ncbi:unnamed protein product, partial [Brachionus calyciflorus]
MPSMDLFKNCRFLDPFKLKSLDQNIMVYQKSIPELKECELDWLVYCDIINDLKFDVRFDLVEFWRSNKKRIPKLYNLAKWLLFYPSNSCECERSISIYNKILSDDRNRLLPETISYLNFLTFNGKKTKEEMIVIG